AISATSSGRRRSGTTTRPGCSPRTTRAPRTLRSSVAVVAFRDVDQAPVAELQVADELARSAIVGPGLDRDRLAHHQAGRRIEGDELGREVAERRLAAAPEDLLDRVAVVHQTVAA